MPGYTLAVAVRPGVVSAPLWRALRAAAAPLTVRELHQATAAHPNAIQLRLKRWEREGRVAVTSTSPRRFRMLDPDPRPPGRPRDGQRRTPSQRQRLWTAIRVLKRFELPQLQTAAEATRRSAEDYVNLLARAGFLRIAHHGNAHRGDWSIYQLARRSGRLSPKVSRETVDGERRRILTDPNSGERFDVSPGAVSLRRARGVNHVG